METLFKPRFRFVSATSFIHSAAVIFLVTAFMTAGHAQSSGEGELNPNLPPGITTDEIIRKFAAREKEFQEARERYTYRQSVKVLTLDGNTPDGEYQQVVDVTFDDKGRRQETVLFAPQSTLQRVTMTREDFDDIQHRYPFVLTSDEIGLYQILYAGQQRVDELDTYVFDIAPKTLQKGQRYFQGRIWVDNRDFQIVKSDGRPAYLEEKKKKGQEQLFPAFVTYREQIDGQYWFPTYTRADEVLHFTNNDVHIRIIVKYTDYKQFKAKTRILYGGEEIGKENPKPPNQ